MDLSFGGRVFHFLTDSVRAFHPRRSILPVPSTLVSPRQKQRRVCSVSMRRGTTTTITMPILSSHGMGGGLPSWREETPRRDGGICGGACRKAPFAVCNVWRIEAHADAREPCTWDEADGWMERCGWMDDVDVRAKEKGVGWTRET